MLFERLIYGWSKTGLEGPSRYQVISASRLFQESLHRRSALIEEAKELCIFENHRLSHSTSRGWLPAGRGLFLFNRTLAGPDSFGRGGSIAAEILYSSEAVDVDAVVRVLLNHNWLSGDYPQGDELPQINSDDLPATLPRPTSLFDQVMTGFLTIYGTTERLEIAASWDKVLHDVAKVALTVADPTIVRHSFSSFEVPDRPKSIQVVGIGSEETRPSANYHVPGIALTEEDRLLAGAVREDREELDLARRLAYSSDGAFSPTTFRALALTLLGGKRSLSTRRLREILRAPEAFDLLVDRGEMAEQAAERLYRDWASLGGPLATILDDVSDPTRHFVLGQLGRRLVLDAEKGVVGPEISVALRHLKSRPNVDFCGYLLGEIVSDPSLIQHLPESVLLDVVIEHGHELMQSGVVDDIVRVARWELIANIVNSSASTRLRAFFLLAALSRRDARFLYLLADVEDRSLVREFLEGLHDSPVQSDELISLVRGIGKDDPLRLSLERWLETFWSEAPSSELSDLLLLERLSYLSDEDVVRTVGAIVEGQSSRGFKIPSGIIGPRVAKRVEDGLVRLILSRAATLKRPLLEAAEERTVMLLASDLRRLRPILTSRPRGPTDSLLTSEVLQNLSDDFSDESRLAVLSYTIDRDVVHVSGDHDVRILVDALNTTGDRGWHTLIEIAAGSLNAAYERSQAVADVIRRSARKAIKEGELGEPRFLGLGTKLDDQTHERLDIIESVAKNALPSARERFE